MASTWKKDRVLRMSTSKVRITAGCGPGLLGRAVPGQAEAPGRALRRSLQAEVRRGVKRLCVE